MTDRFPLIANPSSKRIEELRAGDNLNLQNNSIVGATTITANKFVGTLQGNATSADTLNFAENITSGTISSSRLSGFYGINVNSANILTNAANITSGFISSERLNGSYGINITGIAAIATNLSNASNILTGTINADRLTGFYNISVSSASTSSGLAPGLYDVDISGNAGTATTLSNAANITTGTISSSRLSGSYGINIIGTATTANNLSDAANITTGTISSSRLSGSYGINIIGTATTARDVIGGIASVTSLSVSGISSNQVVYINNSGIVSGSNNLTFSGNDLYVFGNLGIETTNPTSKLHVVGDVLVSGVVTATDFNTTSDINLKTNIHQIEDSLSKVIQIRGVTFDWKENNRSSAGVIAQEVENVLPEFVNGEETKTVNYNGITGALIESIKELKAENDIMKKRLDEVYKKVFG